MDIWEVTDTPKKGRPRKDDPDKLVADFLADNTTFDRDRFYTRSKSNDGSKRKLTIYTPDSYGALEELIVRSDTNPLKMPSELQRHAYTYGLLHLAEMAGKYRADIHSLVRSIIERERRAEMLRQLEEAQSALDEFRRLAEQAYMNQSVEVFDAAVMSFSNEDMSNYPPRIVDEFDRIIETYSLKFQAFR